MYVCMLHICMYAIKNSRMNTKEAHFGRTDKIEILTS